MCQAIPRKVLDVTPDRALVLLDGEPTWVDRRGVPDVKVGEYLVVYAGTALERMSEADATELLSLYSDMEQGMTAEGGSPGAEKPE